MEEEKAEKRGGILRPGDRTPDWDGLEGRPPFGEEEVGLDIAGIRVRLQGLSASQTEWFQQRFGIFATEGLKGSPKIRVDVHDGPEPGFLQLDASGSPEIYRMATEHEGTSITRTWSYRFAGWFKPGEGVGGLAICDAGGRGFESSVENFLRVVYATLALAHEGFLFHSAAIVRGERAYLLFGPSGSGKTTACGNSVGERVLSDDLTLVLPGKEGTPGPRVVSIPFRGHHAEMPPREMSFPVAGFYRLIQDSKVFLEPLNAARGVSEVVGSLPFVTDRPEYGEAVLNAVGKALANAPAYRLHLRKDSSFWAVLDEAMTASGPRDAPGGARRGTTR